MAIGVWEPKKENSIDAEKLKEILSFVASSDLIDLKAVLPQSIVQSDSFLMKKEEADWACLSEFSDTDLILLVKFFTLVEMQIGGWEGEKTSPVIYIVKVLKKRSAFEPELRKWIKASTDNRYLPNGAIF